MLSKSKVKYIQSLSHKKFRDEHNEFVIEGPKIVEEFLTVQPSLIAEVFGVPAWIEGSRDLLSNITAHKINTIDESMLQRISAVSSPNLVVAIAKKKEVIDAPVVKAGLSLLLDEIQDPGNMGTIIRTADWFGIRQIFCSHTCADQYNSKVVQASMGSLLRVDIQYTDLLHLLSSNKKIPVYAATLEGENLYKIKLDGDAMIVIGNESRGVGEDILAQDVKKITIPGAGTAESLNAAVATGIILAQLLRPEFNL